MSALLCSLVGGFAAAPVTISSMTLHPVSGDSPFFCYKERDRQMSVALSIYQLDVQFNPSDV